MNRRGLLKLLGLGTLAAMVPLPDISATISNFFVPTRGGAFSDRLENQILNHVFHGEPMGSRGVTYIALFTAYDRDTVKEVNHAWYRRQKGYWSPAIEGKAFNQFPVAFPICTTDVRITHVGILEQRLGGHALFGPHKLDCEKFIRPGDTLMFATGDLSVDIGADI